MGLMNLDLDDVNRQLRERSPAEVIRWAIGLGRRTVATTSFSPNSAALLHMVKSVSPDLPVIWVDSGYNVADAYLVAEQLMQKLQLNMHIYTPVMSAERRNALMGGIPHPADDADLHAEFVRQVKLEPFQRAITALQPEVWLTGIRREETAFRKTLDIISWDNRGLLRVAPLFYWSEQQLQEYMQGNSLPSCKHYFDPTKIGANAECGLHTAA